MSVYNSVALLKNNTSSEVVIGSVSVGPNASLLFWDTFSTAANRVGEVFIAIRAARTSALQHLSDGYLTMSQDNIDLTFTQIPAVLDQMELAYDKAQGMVNLLTVGLTLNENKDTKGNIKFVEEKRHGSDLDTCTHNFADKTTWYTSSVRITDEIPTDTGDGLRFKLAHDGIIAINSGNIYNEDKVSASIEHGYRVKVTVDDVELCEYSIFEADNQNCQYDVEYRDGYINLHDDAPSGDVKVSYSYATDSTWVLSPKPGKIIQIEKAEVQFSIDVIYNDAIDFEVWAYNPYDLPNKVKMENKVYKSMHNFVDEAAGAYPQIPAVGGPMLGKISPTCGFPFNYNTVRELTSEYGIELRLKTRNGREFGGEWATATFYCTIQDV